MFTAELPVCFSCVQEYGFLGAPENPRKNTENPRTRRDPGAEDGPEGGHQGPRRPGGASTPRPRPQSSWATGTSPVAHPFGPIFTPAEETLIQELFSPEVIPISLTIEN